MAERFKDADTEPGKTIDGSGLVNNLHSIDTTTMWLSDTSDPGSAWIQYDFDKLYKLHEMLVWNYNGPFLLPGSASGMLLLSIQLTALAGLYCPMQMNLHRHRAKMVMSAITLLILTT